MNTYRNSYVAVTIASICGLALMGYLAKTSHEYDVKMEQQKHKCIKACEYTILTCEENYVICSGKPQKIDFK